MKRIGTTQDSSPRTLHQPRDAVTQDVYPVLATTDGSLLMAVKGYNGVNYHPIRIDTTTRAINTITYPHHKVHDGSAFVCRAYKDMPADNVFDIQIVVPNTAKWPHFTFEFDVEAETEFWVYEDVTIVSTGATLMCGNRNRNSSITAGTILYVYSAGTINLANTITSIALATTLANGVIGSGKKLGGLSHSQEEAIFKQNKQYLIRFYSNSAGNVNYHLDWYEHTDKAT